MVNRLADETSPYLRQHATNPVDWYPYAPEAFELARRDDKPVFLSVGYASCHWCHVMAHESFEDPEVAADLSRSFVSVKVDREERPDVDAVYMAAVQSTTGHGGWPMSVFCTPDGRPFFGGTYFPPSDGHGMPSFRRVLASVAEAWRDRRSEVEAQAEELAEAVASEVRLLDRLAVAPPTGETSFAEVLDRLVLHLAGRFDEDWGGWGPAPKFPRPTLVELCLRHYRVSGEERSLTMARRTLDTMAGGGIYDHLAGGFARYSTDRRWLVPHFEKMLTDQALLARAYLHAWQETGEADYRQVAAETIDYVLADLVSPNGGLCSSEDADAGGVEGSHATFTRAQVAEALATDPTAEAAAVAWYGVTAAGNWEETNVLHRPVGAPLARPSEVERARTLLYAARRRRPQPARDDKVLTEWNAMFVAVLAEAAAAAAEPRWAAAAESLADALHGNNRRPDGRWLRSAGSPVPGFAADCAWVVECCTRLAELTGRARWTERAVEAAGQLIDLFWDPARGGLFTVGRDAETPLSPAKEVVDGAVPAAGSVAAQALYRLAALTGGADPRWGDAADRLVAITRPLLSDQPSALADMVAALGWAEGGTEVVVTGQRSDLLDVVRRHWLPDAVVAWGEPTGSPLWEGRVSDAAHVCHRFVCAAPVYDPAALEAQLASV